MLIPHNQVPSQLATVFQLMKQHHRYTVRLSVAQLYQSAFFKCELGSFAPEDQQLYLHSHILPYHFLQATEPYYVFIYSRILIWRSNQKFDHYFVPAISISTVTSHGCCPCNASSHSHRHARWASFPNRSGHLSKCRLPLPSRHIIITLLARPSTNMATIQDPKDLEEHMKIKIRSVQGM